MPKRNDWGISPKSPLAQGTGGYDNMIINENQRKQLETIDTPVDPVVEPELGFENDPDGRRRWARTKRRLGIRRVEP